MRRSTSPTSRCRDRDHHLCWFAVPHRTVDPGDATEEELEVLFQVAVVSIRGNETASGVFTRMPSSTQVFGVCGRARARFRSGPRRPLVYHIANMRDFTRFDDRLVSTGSSSVSTVTAQGQGVEAVFEDGLIDTLEVRSLSLPYCIGNTPDGCEDYETGEVIPLGPDRLPLCGPGVNGPCRDQ